jgi:hypothetical protein
MFVISAIASVLSLSILRLAVRDRDRAQREEWSQAARLVAEANVYGEVINVSLSVLCFLAGLTAVTIPPPPGDFSIPSIWKLICLIAVSVLVVVQGSRSLWYRRRILGLESVRLGPVEETAIHDFGGSSSRAQ